MKIIVPLVLLLIFSCHKQSSTLRIKVQQSENLTDEDFEVFFNRFNTDSIFQISRVDFPLKVVELNTDNLTEDTLTLNESNYQFNKIDKKSKDYTIEQIIKPDSVKILLKGIDNGIYLEYFFLKKNEKWKLNTWNDSST